jgi:hypothetical protein
VGLISCFFTHFSPKLILKLALSHCTLDGLSPSNASESDVGGEEVNWIQVQPHCVSKDKKPILDYDSNNDFEEQEFNNSDTPTGQATIRGLEDFISQDGYEKDMNVDDDRGRHRCIDDDFAASHEEGFMEDFTIATQENSGRFIQATQENSGQFTQAPHETIYKSDPSK